MEKAVVYWIRRHIVCDETFKNAETSISWIALSFANTIKGATGWEEYRTKWPL